MKQFLPFLYILSLFLCCKKKDSIVTPPESKLPTLITHPYADLTRFSVRISGTITDSAGSKILEAGFIVDTVSSPTIQKNLNKFVRVPDNKGNMLAIITNIPANKTWYFRSYAKTQEGVGYGNEIKFTSLPEKVFDGNATLSTQQEVETFGSKHYTTINGSLTITGSVTDLSPLKNLAIVNYAFNVQWTNQLTTLKGLDSLEAVNGLYFFHGMRIENNSALKDLIGLDKLTGNNGYLYIRNNDQLTDLTGLEKLYYNHFGELRIEGCTNLRSLHGLENFSWLDGDIMLKDNPKLTDITAFGNLSFLSGRISIINNASLPNLTGFSKLHKIEALEVYDNLILPDLKGFSNLDTIISGFSLRNNAALKNLNGLEKITTTAYVNIENSPSLTSLEGLQNLKTITGKLTIWTSGLSNMKGLDNLVSLPSIELVMNDQLQDLQGLNNLTALTNNTYALTITRNLQLKSLTGLEKLTTAPGQIYIGFNSLLNDFCPLKPLMKTDWKGYLITEGNAVNPTPTSIATGCP